MSAPKRLVIVDFEMGNLFSVKRVCELLGCPAEITQSADAIENADAIILPGVGAFADAMKSLADKDLVTPLRAAIARKTPFMGVCLGMQLLMERSFEFGEHQGLGVIAGEVRRLQPPEITSPKIPQVCWNRLLPTDALSWDGSPLRGLPHGVHMYFVHSFVVTPSDPAVVLSTTTYGDTTFCSSLLRDNIFACQYHPERSGKAGIEIYRNFLSL